MRLHIAMYKNFSESAVKQDLWSNEAGLPKDEHTQSRLKEGTELSCIHIFQARGKRRVNLIK